jgi:His-Xaa-Ser system radical SAM maturase HxsB
MTKYKKNYFNFKKLNKKYLLTNDWGNYTFLSEKHFENLINNKNLPKDITTELDNKQFIYFDDDESFINIHTDKLKDFKDYMNSSTVLHIFVVSKNCNYNCLYCQAGNLDQKEELLMSKETAKKAVDIALSSPSPVLDFEFQGGEPLTNFDAIKYIVEYSQQKNDEAQDKKEIAYTIVSNLSLLTDEMVAYIKQKSINICTSIDGNKELQNKNRPFIKDSYESTMRGIKILQENNVNVSALLTTTKFSLDQYQSIVDEYINLGLQRICVRPLTRIGKASLNWNSIGYDAKEFVEFYQKILSYIINKNLTGDFLIEGMAQIFLKKIINGEAVNYMELRSPCGGAIGQLAYYYDGNIYTCDEGRMLAEMGDKKFYLGNVYENSFDDIIKSGCTKEICNASCIECSPICHSCPYLPFCGTCPVINYFQTHDLCLTRQNDYRCTINKGILDELFSYIQNDEKVLRIFEQWIKYD